MWLFFEIIKWLQYKMTTFIVLNFSANTMTTTFRSMPLLVDVLCLEI